MKTFKPFGSATSRKQDTKDDEREVGEQVLDLVIRASVHAERALLIAERVMSGEVLSDEDRAQLVANVPSIRASLKQIVAALERARG